MLYIHDFLVTKIAKNTPLNITCQNILYNKVKLEIDVIF